MIRQMAPAIKHWYVGGLSEPAGRCVDLTQWPHLLAEVLPKSAYTLHENIPTAYAQALAANQGERLLVFGSFHTLEAIMRIPQ